VHDFPKGFESVFGKTHNSPAISIPNLRAMAANIKIIRRTQGVLIKEVNRLKVFNY
jgi:hypothetical protein